MSCRTLTLLRRVVCVVLVSLSYSLLACSMGETLDWSLAPIERTVRVGETATYTVQILSKTDIGSRVTIRLIGLPAGLTGVVTPSELAPATDEARIEITPAAGVEPGTYEFEVSVAEVGVVSWSRDARLTVDDTGGTPTFVVEVNPIRQTYFVDGPNPTYTYSVTPANGYAGTVNVSLVDVPPDFTVEPLLPDQFIFTADNPVGQTGNFALRWLGRSRRQVENDFAVEFTDGTITRRRTVTVDRPASDPAGQFVLLVDPAEVTFAAPHETYSIDYEVIARNGFRGTVEVTVGERPSQFALAPGPTPGSLTLGLDPVRGSFGLYWGGDTLGDPPPPGPLTVEVIASANGSEARVPVVIHRPDD